MSVQDKAERLRAVIKLLTDACKVIIEEWEIEEQNSSVEQSDGSSDPSQELYNATAGGRP